MSARGTTLNVTEQLTTEECFTCHVLFAMPTEMRDRKVEDKTNFWCPNGHTQHYIGKTSAQREKERADELAGRLANVEADRARYQEWLRTERERHKATERSLNATKGVVTRQRKRAQAALCPVDGCGRSFVQLRRHLTAKHPDYHAHD